MENDYKRVLAVERTMAILTVLSAEGPILLSDVARCVGIHKSTVFRFLQTLSDLGYVYKDGESEEYSLTEKMNVFITHTSERGRLQQQVIPIMEELSRVTKETIHLAVLEDYQLQYIDKIESTEKLRVVISSQKGGAAPLYCTGLGKALLAWLSKEEQIRIANSLVYLQYTQNTLASASALLAELEIIKKQGYAVDNEEHEKGIVCIAAPICTSKGKPIAALSITGPAFRMHENINGYAKLIVESVQDLF